MDKTSFKSELMLLLAALIWGFCFTAQKAGMEHVGPFTYNAARNLLGGLTLVPVALLYSGEKHSSQDNSFSAALLGGLIAGFVLFLASSIQQIGIVNTTAGKAGFITCLYVILVPVFRRIGGQKAGAGIWTGAVLALAGIYLLSFTGEMDFSRGDLIVFASSIFWAFHIIVIGRFSGGLNVIKLACLQFLFCSLFSFICAFIFEEVRMDGIIRAAGPIMFAGFFSTAIAFTLQVAGQKKANPSHAALIMSLESLFAVLGGFIVLGEVFSGRESFGSLLMFAGMLFSVLYKREQFSGKQA